MNNRSVYSKIGILAIGLVILSVAVHYANYFILNKAPVAQLQTSTLSSAISKSIGDRGTGSYPAPGKDFTIRSIRYFMNNTWAVADISTISGTGSSDNAVVVLQEKNGQFTTALGPGSSFPASSLPSLPTQVLFYLNTQGLINNGA